VHVHWFGDTVSYQVFSYISPQILTSVLRGHLAAMPMLSVLTPMGHIPALVNLDILEMDKFVQVRYYSNSSLKKRDKTGASFILQWLVRLLLGTSKGRKFIL